MCKRKFPCYVQSLLRNGDLVFARGNVVLREMRWRLFLVLLRTEELNVSLWKIGGDTGVEWEWVRGKIL